MKIPTSSADKAKFAAARAAIDLVMPGMRLGIGTGSTAAWFVELLGARVADGLEVICVPTSSVTEAQAKGLGIPLTTLDEAGWLDLTIDGADEFDADLNLIKGGGGALLQEMIVASASDRMVVISDDSKEVAQMGAFPLPVEVVRFGWKTTQTLITRLINAMGYADVQITPRQKDGAIFVTDEGHYILDLHLNKITDARALSIALNRIPGVVETGLFIDIAHTVLVGYEDGRVRLIDAAGEGTALQVEVPK